MGKFEIKVESFPLYPHVYNKEMVDNGLWVYITSQIVEKQLWGMCITLSTEKTMQNKGFF